MRPEEKCVSQPTAVKLRDAGLPQDTERYWMPPEWRSGDVEWSLWTINEHYDYEESFSVSDVERCGGVAAPDAQEIELPSVVGKKRLNIHREKDDTWDVLYIEPYKDEIWFQHKNEAEARAAAFLWLKENKLI